MNVKLSGHCIACAYVVQKNKLYLTCAFQSTVLHTQLDLGTDIRMTYLDFINEGAYILLINK